MIALFSLSLLATSAAPSERRTVMAFLSTGVENWAQCKSFLDEGGEAAGTVNAVSICNCYHFDPSATPMITPNPDVIAAHVATWQQPGSAFRTFPLIGFGGNISALQPLLSNATEQQHFVDFLVSEAVRWGYDGLNIDFEPLTDVLHPDNNPSPRDALGLAKLLAALGGGLRAANKTLQLDAMAVTGACWTSGGHKFPALDRKPCPWIRSFWDLSALAEVRQLDRIISMDTYTANSSEFPADLVQYQYFFPVERIGIGLRRASSSGARRTSVPPRPRSPAVNLDRF